jgi:chromate transporter
MTIANRAQPRPHLPRLAWVFTRYGNFTLGGGSATAVTLHRELVERRHWLTDEQFTLCFALGRLTPGTNLLAFSTGFGWVLREPAGAVTALLASSILCAIMVTAVTALFTLWRDDQFAQAAIHGAIAAAWALPRRRAGPLPNPISKARGVCASCWLAGSPFCSP